MTPDVTQVEAQANFELLVTFADGVRKQFSMLPYLNYPAFSQLNEPGKFAFAHVANGTVQWTEDKGYTVHGVKRRASSFTVESLLDFANAQGGLAWQ